MRRVAGWVWLEFGLAVVTFAALRFVTAPYGRHERSGWGPTVPARAGWLLMETPAAVLFAVFWATGENRAGLVPVLLLVMWECHYCYRAFWYPFLLRGRTRMPVLVVLLAIGFNTLNAWVNGRWITAYGSYPLSWLADPRFIVGAALFVLGLSVHVRADRTLRALRNGGAGYRIPQGGPYRWVSCPNYLGEIVEWSGWALAAWSPAGAAFAAYTVANLAPRALDHHKWYRDTFPDYPPARRALVPYLL